MDFPSIFAVSSTGALWLSAQLGAHFGSRRAGRAAEEQQDLDVILTAVLTLLGLIIGFTFSMSVTRYDLRKNYEEEEANAIGTEYLRVGLLAEADASALRSLMAEYLQQRILFYRTKDAGPLAEIDARTSKLQGELWSAVQTAATAKPTPVVALAVSGMNDVLNSQGYTQAAWWNRIPGAAWALLVAIAVGASLLFGYSSHSHRRHTIRFLVLPIVVGISFFLIAELDSPRTGIIRVGPQNLMVLSFSPRGN